MEFEHCFTTVDESDIKCFIYIFIHRKKKFFFKKSTYKIGFYMFCVIYQGLAFPFIIFECVSKLFKGKTHLNIQSKHKI